MLSQELLLVLSWDLINHFLSDLWSGLSWHWHGVGWLSLLLSGGFVAEGWERALVKSDALLRWSALRWTIVWLILRTVLLLVLSLN